MVQKSLLGIGAGIISGAGVVLGVRSFRQRHRRRVMLAYPMIPSQLRSAQQVYAIFNPVKRDYARARGLVERLVAAAGWPEVVFLDTSIDSPGTKQARRAVAEGADVVLAGGGDGTVRAVAEGLVRQGVPLGVVPLGTGNVLIRNVGGNAADLDGSVRSALFGYESTIDTGMMDVEFVGGGVGSYRFLVMSGIGLDAQVMGGTSDGLKNRIGWIAYSEAGLRYFPGRRQRMRIVFDDGYERQCQVHGVLFANCGLIPGGIDFVPQALLDDGVLDVVVAGPRNMWQWFRVAAKVLFKSPHEVPGLDFYAARRVVVEPVGAAEVEVDGDPVGAAVRLTAWVEPQSLVVRLAGQ